MTKINYDSFSNFWILTDDFGKVLDNSSYFKKLELIDSSIQESFEFLQPTLTNDLSISSRLQGKIIHFKNSENQLSFRATIHNIGNEVLWIAWPLLNNLSDVKKYQLYELMHHPACVLTDILILKDVVSSHVSKLKQLKIDQIEKELDDQLVINEHQSKFAAIGELASRVGHEINNPLTIAIFSGSIIEKNLDKETVDKDKILAQLESQKKAYERIRIIVNSLRINTVDNKSKDQVFSLHEAVFQSLDFIDDIYKKEGVQLISKLNSSNYLVKGNQGEFKQAVVNLLTNAKDATENKKDRKIELKTFKKEKYAYLSISDNGVGIEKEVKTKIFNPFFTTKKFGHGPGLGLGLVEKVATKMGGKVSFESTLNKGSTFTLKLLIEDICDGGVEEDNIDAVEELALRGKALVVDDDEEVLYILRYFLEDLGLDVDSFTLESDALDALKESEYKYVISDFIMPNMRGDEFLRKARKLTDENTYFFMASGGVTPGLRENLKVTKLVDGFLEKPFSSEVILDVLTKAESKEN